MIATSGHWLGAVSESVFFQKCVFPKCISQIVFFQTVFPQGGGVTALIVEAQRNNLWWLHSAQILIIQLVAQHVEILQNPIKQAIHICKGYPWFFVEGKAT